MLLIDLQETSPGGPIFYAVINKQLLTLYFLRLILCPKTMYSILDHDRTHKHINASKVFDPSFCSKVCDWLGQAGRCVLRGPWRLTEPCDVTIGGATWLDQAQETAARANQNAGPHRKKAGQQRAAPISQGVGSIQDRRGNRQLQIHTGRGAGPENRP